MPTNSQDLRDRLAQTDPEFGRLSATHRELDTRLLELSHKPYLSEAEQFEEVTLKKKKLQLKDQMEEILQRHRGDHATEAAHR
jgi:uncharacterized protein YdcH (DUF465 family)